MKRAVMVLACVLLAFGAASWVLVDSPAAPVPPGPPARDGFAAPGPHGPPASRQPLPTSPVVPATIESRPRSLTDPAADHPAGAVDLGRSISVDDGYWLESGGEGAVSLGEDLDADATGR